MVRVQQKHRMKGALLMLAIASAVGCASHRAGSVNQCCQISEKLLLNALPYQTLESLDLQTIAETVSQTKLGTSIRVLTLSNCEQLAAQTAPKAKIIERQVAWLSDQDLASETLLAVAAFQAQYERNVHVGNALEAYWDLANTYAQQPGLEQGRLVLDDAEQTVLRFRESGISSQADPAEFGRAELDLDRKEAELVHAQNQLLDGLSLLLALDLNDRSPIWTSDTSGSSFSSEDQQQAIAVALDQRGDLQAMRTLMQVSDWESLEQGQQIVGTQIPLSVGPSATLLAVWNCLKKNDLERQKAEQLCSLRQQLQQLIYTKERLVEQEVRGIFSSLDRYQKVLQLNLEEVSSLQQTMTTAEQGKDLRPIDFQQRLQQQQRMQLLNSQIIQGRVAIERDRVRLRQSQGLLGRMPN